MNKARLCLIAVFAAEQIIFPVANAFAQQPAEQEINPQFQQELQSSGGSASALPAPASSSEPGDVAMPAASTPGTPMNTVGSTAPQPLYEDVEARSPLDTKISVRLKDAPLTAFLDAISAQARISFVMAEGLQEKKVTAFLRQIAVKEALQILLQLRGLTYQRIGKTTTYVVMKRSSRALNLITKIYTLNYISLMPVTSESQSVANITSSDVSFSGSSSNRGATVTASGDASGVAIIPVLASVLTRAGHITTEPRTNSLIITDVPESFPQVDQIIQELDRKAPQLLIEVQIVEINASRLNALGIEWGGDTGEMAYFQGGSRSTDYLLRSGFFTGDNWKHLYADSGTLADNGITQGTFSLTQLKAQLHALVSRSEARYLAKPKIVTLNNQTAIVTMTKDAAVGVTTATSSTGSESGTIERKRVGITLRVTPQVNKDGYITLLMQPSYADVQASSVTSNEQTVYDPISRGISTIARVKNGQTVVLGGLLQNTDTHNVRKVPLLGYIPIVGWFFTYDYHKRENTDLVMFVTPTILVD